MKSIKNNMENTKIKYKDKEHQIEVQKWLFSQGYEWLHSKKEIQNYTNDFGCCIDGYGKITRISEKSLFYRTTYKEIEYNINPIYEIY